MKFELSIDAAYLDTNRWDAAAGIREFMQNGRDAAIEQDAPLDVSFRPGENGKGTLVITNEGAVLARDSLLLGRSTKRDRQSELAGKWGEGLKLGALALLRAGFSIKIRNGGEVWVPSIEPSEKFDGRPVLVFDIQSGRKEVNRVQVEIEGIAQDDWKTLKDHFLFLYKRDIELVKVEGGALLLSPKFKGRVYVKGILVVKQSELEYGYDLADADLDRDRRIIDSYDLRTRTQRIWSQALEVKPELFDQFYTMLEGRANDLEGLSKWNTYSIPEFVRSQAAARFKSQHGDNAVPVENLAVSKDLEHLGAKGVITSSPFAALLRDSLGSAEEVQERLKKEVTKVYSWSDLAPKQADNLQRAIDILGSVKETVDLATLEIVSFRSKGLRGQYEGGIVRLARDILDDRSETLGVLVHEVAHRHGSDGDKGHVAAIEALWAAIVEKLSGN